MHQIKIGKFIAERRKKNSLTQMRLAEKLNITDRAVSKWENGKSMPDSSIMLDLCSELKISVNELLCGRTLEMDDYNEKAEKNLLELKRQKEESDKRLLTMEVVMGAGTVVMFLALVMLASLVDIEDWLRFLIIIPAFVFLFFVSLVLLRNDQTAGYYECKKCHHKYVPTYKSVLWAPHINRTRYMRCPKCGKRSWQRKIISADKTSK